MSMLVLVLFSGCATPFDDAALAETLWADIQGYEAWGQFDGWSDTPVESGSHAGDFVRSYADDTMLVWNLTGEAPDGATAVKDQRASADAPAPEAFTVMRKIAGYDPEHGDWFWARFEAEGAVTVAGQAGACTGCHSQVAETSDWVFGPLPE